MKKLLLTLTAAVLCLSMAVPGFADEAAEPSEYDFEGFTQIYTEGVWDEPTVFNLLPDGYNTYETENAGTDVVIHYTTDVYGDTYEKFCRVYLPYGYDPEDTETKYNVIYFQHGNSGSPNELFDHDMKSLHALNLLNNIFDPDHRVIDPAIIVCPTFYLEYDESAYVTPGDNPAGDGRYEGIEDKYYQEILEDLIPTVESQFNVYCEDFSPEGIAATRDHRAWAGYSRGSADTWKLFTQDLAYFKYWMPMSCKVMQPGSRDEISDEDAFEYLKAAVDANPDLDFFILATAGGPNDAQGMQEQLEYFAQQSDTFSFGNDPSVNNLYFIRSEFNHNDLYFPYSLANTGDIFFK